MILAFAISIALHEIVAGAIPAGRSQPQSREIVSTARLLHITLRAVPTPIAQPAPKPIVTPQPAPMPKPRVVIAPVTRIAVHTPRRTQAHRAAAHIASNARPVWDSPVGMAASHTITAPGGLVASAGTGVGSQGNGSEAHSGEQPCGLVTFSDPHGSHFDPRTRGFWVDIRMSVHFADGSLQSMILDYPWYYPSEAANPWSDQNLKDPGFPTRFQTPPPSKIGSEPSLVQYVVTHSTPDGMTLLKDCP